MTDKLEDTSLRLKDEMDLYRKIMDKLWQNRHDFQKEKEAMQEVSWATYRDAVRGRHAPSDLPVFLSCS